MVRSALALAVAAMLVQNGFAYMSTLAVPVMAPTVAAAMGVETALVGGYVALIYTASTLSALGCGGFIVRYGALRMAQISLLLMGSGLMLSAIGTFWAFLPSALVIGTGSAISTPASSHLLFRLASPREAPVVFSIKQAGVPMGGMLAGLLVPAFVGLFGWQGALLALGCMCWLVGLAMQPLRARYDGDRRPGHPIRLGDSLAHLRYVLGQPALRALTVTCFAFVGLQAVFGAFLVTFLHQAAALPLATAGAVFAGAQLAAVVSRVAWGWLAGRLGRPQAVLGVLGLAMAAAAVAVALVGPGWPLALIALSAGALSATALSWHGVLLAEVANRAPAGAVGGTTGGVLGVASTAMMLYPASFGAVLAATQSFTPGFLLAALPAAAVGVMMLTARRVSS